MTAPIKLAIFLSGRGSNFQAIYHAIHSQRLTATISVVVSDNPSAAGILFAQEHQLPTLTLSPKSFPSMTAYEAEVLAQLSAYKIDLVVLAGYMRIVGPTLLTAFANKMINIHPSLLPKYKGLHAPRQAVADAAIVSGCTVHYVDDTLDGGPIIAQVSVPVLADDTEDSLSARILVEEHRLLPSVIQTLAEKRNGERSS